MPSNTDTIQLRSEEVQDILTAVPLWMIRWGNTLIFFLIIGVISISYFVKYPDIIAADAVITTQLPPQKVYAKTTGQIDTILLIDNQYISANTPIAIIENSASFEDVFFLKSIIDTISINNNHFAFPIDDIPFLTLGEIAPIYALFQNSIDQYMMNHDWQPYSNEDLANRQSLTELKSRLENLKAQQVMNLEELDVKQNGLERSKLLFEQGVISAVELENKQLESIQSKRSFEDRKLTISQVEGLINDANLKLKTTIINQSKEEKMLLRTVIQSFQQLQKEISDWEQKYVLRSNIDGQVAFLDYWTENQTINAGDMVFTIIPQEKKDFLAKLKTPNLNSGKIQKDQTVYISLKNYPETEFGVLKGKIEKISLMTDKDGFYIVDVSLPSNLITSYEREIEFKQEMEGSAEIVTEELRLIDRFFSKIKGILKR